MNQPAEGIPIPQRVDLSKMDPKALFDQLQEERRSFERRLHEANSRAKMDLDRLRASTAQHTNDLEAENKTLMKSLTRLQQENDRLNQELTILRVRLEHNGQREAEAPAPFQVGAPPAPAVAVPTRLAAPQDPVQLGTIPIAAVQSGPSLDGAPIPQPPKR